MWKYVTRRLKETFERTCNSFDSYRSWCCKATNSNNLQNNNDGCSCSTSSSTTTTSNFTAAPYIHTEKDCIKIFDNLCFCVVKPKCDFSNFKKLPRIGSNGAKKEKFNDNHAKAHDDFLSVITWSGAIVFGWYASQLICLQSRYGKRKAERHFHHPIIATSRAIHTNTFPYWLVTSSNQSPLLTEKIIRQKFDFNPLAIKQQQQKQDELDQKQFAIVNINNENESSENATATTTSSEFSSNSTASSGSSQKQSADEAVSDLVKFLGETEFKLAIQYISAGQYRSAVTHLKLASRHHHVGATFNLGLCYEQGLGVTKNLKRAMECYQYASSVGHPKAMYNLGVFYARGLGGLKKDHVAARQCFIAAAKLGQNEAKVALGWSEIGENPEMLKIRTENTSKPLIAKNMNFTETNNRNVTKILD